MLLLTSTSDKIQIVTSGSGTDTEVHVSYVDNNSNVITPSRTNTAHISSATTTDVVSSPSSGIQRNVKFLSVFNNDGTNSITVTIQHTDGTTTCPLWKGTLLAGESINFTDQGMTWQYLDANGAVKPGTVKLDVWKCVNRISGATSSAGGFSTISCLSVELKANIRYVIEAHLYSDVAVSTTGQWFAIDTISGGSPTIIGANFSGVTNSVTAGALAVGSATAFATAFTAQTTGAQATPTLTILSATILVGNFDQVLNIRVAPEVASALNVEAGSWLHVRELDN